MLLSGKRVIVVTDGDRSAREALEVAARNINGRCISISSSREEGHGRLDAKELTELVLSTPHDPVVVMVDDGGESGEGRGEKLLRGLMEHPDIEVLGVVAVASNAPSGKGVKVDASVSRDGSVIAGPVDKKGYPQGTGKLHGDTVGILSKLDIPVTIGLGDPGKMDYADEARSGAPITTKALQAILERAGHMAGAAAKT